MRRLLRVLRGEAGYSLTELLVVTVILGIILGALTTAFVEGSNAELTTNRQFQAQQQAIAAFDRLRRDIHCAAAATISGTTMTLTGCATGTVSWCAAGSGTRYGLYRQAAATCASTTGTLYADYLTSSSVFSYTAQSTSSLAKVHVSVPVSVRPGLATAAFQLTDDIVLRNSTRT